MIIKINSQKYNVKPISRLSVLEYMIIVNNVRYIDLISYISAMVGIEIDKATVEMNNIEVAEAMLLDQNIDFSEMKPPLLFPYNNENLIVDQIDDGTFGKRYMFNIYRKQYEDGKLGIAELCVYALALCLSKKDDFSDVDEVYTHLTKMNWQVILPIGFFLSKKLSGKRNFLTIFLLKLIVRSLYLMKSMRPKVTHTT